MCDIKTEPEEPVCHGCLSRDRELSPLILYDLYWSLLTEDQKIEALAKPQISMCWECTAMVQKIQKFQLQVQKAHTILQDSLALSPTEETLSQLGVQHKREYDAIFDRNTLLKQLPESDEELAILNEDNYDMQYKEDTEDVNNAPKCQEAVKTSNKCIASERKQYSEDECKTEKSSDNDDDNIEADDMCSSDDEIHPEQNKLRRSVRRKTQKSSQTFKKPKQKRGIDEATLPMQFVSPDTEILLAKLDKTDVKIKKVKNKTTKPFIKTPLIAQVEMQLQKLIKMQNNSQNVKNSNETTSKDINEVRSIFRSDDDNRDEGFDNYPVQDEAIDVAYPQLTKKEKAKRASLVVNPELLKLEQELKTFISKNAKTGSDTNDRKAAKRKINEYPEPDSDLNPEGKIPDDINEVQSGFLSDDDNRDEGFDYYPAQDEVIDVAYPQLTKKERAKRASLVVNPELLKLEQELKTFISKNAKTGSDTNDRKAAKRKINENPEPDPDFNPEGKIPDDINEVQSGFLSDDDNRDEGFDNYPAQDEVIDVAYPQLTKKERAKRASLVVNPELLKLEQELKTFISKNAKAWSDTNDRKAAKKKINENPEPDPDFKPEDKISDEDDDEYVLNEKKTYVDGENKDKPNKLCKYRKFNVRYMNIEDVLQYFTETEMSEQEYRSILEKEDAVVDDKRPQKCFECGRTFPYRRTLLVHAKNIHHEHDTRMKKIKTPTYIIPEPPEKPRLWGCDICRRLLRREHIVAHMNECHRLQWACNGKGCEWSPKVFWDKDDMMEHWANIHKRFECSYCGRRCRQKSALDWHMQEAHIQSCQIPCSQCLNVFATRKDLYQHVRLHHAEPGPPELRYCVECDVTFRNPAHYRVHLSGKHKPKKKYPCDKCGKELMNKETLESHAAIYHGGVTRFQCEICGKYMSKKATLEVHVLRHKNIVIKRPNNKPCVICGRKFQSNRVLRHHMYTHTGERPYACTLCDAAYTQPYCLKLHLTKAHGVQKP